MNPRPIFDCGLAAFRIPVHGSQLNDKRIPDHSIRSRVLSRLGTNVRISRTTNRQDALGLRAPARGSSSQSQFARPPLGVRRIGQSCSQARFVCRALDRRETPRENEHRLIHQTRSAPGRSIPQRQPKEAHRQYLRNTLNLDPAHSAADLTATHRAGNPTVSR